MQTPRPLVSALLLLAHARASAGGGQLTNPEVDGIASVSAADYAFGSTALDASKGRTFAQTSHINQNFLRRGTRADIERIHIERLLGRRGPDDWLLAGSDAWLTRRDKLDREAMELRERIAIGDACLRSFNIEEWTIDLGCSIYCGRRFPCAGCKDGLYNGDEGGVDCGGSCVPCPTCDDMIHNGDETGIDCGGNVCDACEVFAPEPEPGQVCDPNFGVNCQSVDPDLSDIDASFRPLGCLAPDPRDCILRNRWTAQSGAHLENQPYYQPTADFYPWVRGSIVYNSSHWRDYTNGTEPIYLPDGSQFVPADNNVTTPGAHTMYG